MAIFNGVIHAGFIHDFTRLAEVCEADKVAIQTIGEVLDGSGRPFIVTSGAALVSSEETGYRRSQAAC